MSMPPPNMPLPPNEDRGDAATAVFWTLTSIAVIIVAARFYARWIIRGIGLDDWMILVSLVLFITTSGFVTHIAQLGGFRHLIYVPLENGKQVAMSMLLAQVFNIIAFGTSKFAVGYQLLRVLDRTSVWRKSFVWVIVVVTLLYNTIEGVLTMFQCTPAKAAWDPMVKGDCWTMHTKLVNIYVGGGYNIATDVILALLPLPTIWELNLSLRDRIRLCILLGLGLLAAVCSSVKLSYADSINNLQDLTWGTYELDIWSGAELFVIIVCCSIPPLHVFWQRVVKESSLYARGSKVASGNSNGSRDEKRNSRRFAADPRARHVPIAVKGSAAEDDEAKLWPSPKPSPATKHSSHFSVASESELSHFGRGIAAVTEISVESRRERSDAGSDVSSIQRA